MNKALGLFIVCAAAVSAPAQVTLSILQGGATTTAGEIYDMGSVPLGTVAAVSLQLTNTGPKGVYLTNLALNGAGFSVACAQSPDLCGGAPLQQLPILIGSTGTLKFTVQFQPLTLGSPSANLTIDAGNTISLVLMAKCVPGLAILQSGQPLTAGQTVNFGSVQMGSSATVKLMLANPAANPPVTLPAIPPPLNTDFTLAGSALTGPALAGGASAELDLVFAPSGTGPRQGTLTIGLLQYTLLGIGLPAPAQAFPNPSVQINLATVASAQQGRVAVNLASAATIAGSGTVTLTFQPADASMAGDPTVTFADGTRSAAFTVAQGATACEFAGQPTVSFATGTTAGTLTFDVTLGSSTGQAAVTIPASAVVIDSAYGQRDVACDSQAFYCTSTNLELQVVAWDNSRTASQLVFSFFDASGAAISTGSFTVNAGAAFQTYFGESDLGGVFEVHAFFPVTGDPNQVASAVVQISNAAGSVQSAKIVF